MSSSPPDMLKILDQQLDKPSKVTTWRVRATVRRIDRINIPASFKMCCIIKREEGVKSQDRDFFFHHPAKKSSYSDKI